MVVHDKVCQLPAQGLWFSPGTQASSTTNTDRHNMTEILLKALIKQTDNITIGRVTWYREYTVFLPLYLLWYFTDCPKNISLPRLPESTACHIPDFCTGVTCCTEIELLQRAVTTSVKLDPCLYTLEVQIEKLVVNISLVDYEFTKQDHVYLLGAIRLE